MRTNKADSISFGTTIKIVAPYKFRSITNKMKKIKNCQKIYDWDIVPYYDGTTPAYRTNVAHGYTEGVRSCTAVLSVKEGDAAPFFGHMAGSKYNACALPLVKNEMKKGDNAIIIGAKAEYTYSVDFCNKVQRIFKRNRIPTTKLCIMNNLYEASIAYESLTDTLYLCLKDCYKDIPYVKSMNDLRKVCKQVDISPKDKIVFPNLIQLFLGWFLA